MPSLAERPMVVGFFSYSREDDEAFKGSLSALRDGIQRELSAQLGRSRRTFRLWQDQEAIAPGKLWESEIRAAVDEAVFFIPIVTPRTVNSRYCKFEFDMFLAREKALARTDLVFPILYIAVPSLDDEAAWGSHPILATIAQRQYVDWRPLRHLDVSSTVVRETIERFCERIVEALNEPMPDVPASPKPVPVAAPTEPPAPRDQPHASSESVLEKGSVSAVEEPAPPPVPAPKPKPAPFEEPPSLEEPPKAPARAIKPAAWIGLAAALAILIGGVGAWWAMHPHVIQNPNHPAKPGPIVNNTVVKPKPRTSTAANEAVSKCDALAGSPDDSGRPRGVTGIAFTELNPTIAIPACQAALGAQPQLWRMAFNLGRAYMKSGDRTSALHYYQLAGRNGYAAAETAMGSLYRDGIGVPQSYDQAMVWYKLAAAQNDSVAENEIGWLFQNGKGTEADSGAARYWYERSARAGLPTGQYNLGYLYEHGLGVKQSYPIALQWFMKAAQAGFAPAQSTVGYFYENGLGVNRDYAQARYWFQRAADQNDPSGLNSLGFLYQRGLGVPQDYAQAKSLYQRAADLGLAVGQYNLGWLYENGPAGPKDFVQARVWLQKAANQNFAPAQNDLAILYQRGQGGPQDYKIALDLLNKAAAQNYAPAQDNLGYTYENGLGVPKNLNTAKSWYEKASAQGLAQAKAALQRLAAK